MKTIGSHPGAITFRLSVMIILILILMVVFLRYFDSTQREIERASILQTKRIIDSSLSVVFATYAVNGKLDELNQLEGSNPFEFLSEYQLVPSAYRGVLEDIRSKSIEPGWYYLSHEKTVVYIPRYLEVKSYFVIVLNYEDRNQSGIFEPTIDRFKNLQFIKKPR